MELLKYIEAANGLMERRPSETALDEEESEAEDFTRYYLSKANVWKEAADCSDGIRRINCINYTRIIHI